MKKVFALKWLCKQKDKNYVSVIAPVAEIGKSGTRKEQIILLNSLPCPQDELFDELCDELCDQLCDKVFDQLCDEFFFLHIHSNDE